MLALASRWLRDGAGSIGAAATAARSLGFASVFASEPPTDAAKGKGALDALGLSLAGVGAAPVAAAGEVRGAIDRAAAAASALRRPLVVLDLGDAIARKGEAAEEAVEHFARALFESMRAFSGLAVAVRPAGISSRLFGLRETEWLLDALDRLPIGVLLDPARALSIEREGKGPAPVVWADRLASKTLGVALHGLGSAGGHAHPEGVGSSLGPLPDLLPSRAVRVLDVGPAVPAEDVVDARRKFEEVLRW